MQKHLAVTIFENGSWSQHYEIINKYRKQIDINDRWHSTRYTEKMASLNIMNHV